jgi:eukaryotic-like serine/threonine-protein kinase
VINFACLYPQVFGKYVLERELSRGGMARVILATLRGAGGFEKRLVVKQIRDELAFDHQFVRRFVEEAKTTVALSHPNIVPVYELGVEQGTYFLAMELVEGLSVAELLRERNPDGSRRVLTPEEGAYVGVEVCRALDYAHRRMKVVHRDITPRNVMIDEEGQIKLIDFGIAAPALVAGHEILGSPGHMAPEQVDGGQLGPPTDIFAVAVLLMEAWTGSAPFRRATPEECAAAVREAHPKPSEFDPRLLPIDGAIGTAMEVDAAARQQEASELARSLRAFLQGIDVADIARALGDRVREARERAEAPAPPSRHSAPRSSVASHSELGTKTFAARDEWSTPPEPLSVEDLAAAPSTRLIHSKSTPPPPLAPPASSASPPAKARREDPAMGIPTPLMVDVEELERIHAGIAAAGEAPPPATPSSGPRSGGAAPKQTDIPTVRRPKVRPPSASPSPADKLETIATRPLETPVRSPERRVVAEPSGRGSRLFGGIVLASVIAVGAFVAWRTREVPGAGKDVRPPVTTTTATASPTDPATSSATAPSVSPTTSIAMPAPPRPTGSASTAAPPVPSTSVSAAIAQGKAALSLLGDPGTRVWVDGTARGSCPARVAVEAGAHEVRFTFDPTGESRVERLTVKGGDHVTVKSDFTGASPTVTIQR